MNCLYNNSRYVLAPVLTQIEFYGSWGHIKDGEMGPFVKSSSINELRNIKVLFLARPAFNLIVPRTSKKGDQITWYIPRSLSGYVKNIQKNEKLSRNETISLLVELGIKLNKHKDLLVKTAERKNISQDTVLEEMFRQTKVS